MHVVLRKASRLYLPLQMRNTPPNTRPTTMYLSPHRQWSQHVSVQRCSPSSIWWRTVRCEKMEWQVWLWLVKPSNKYLRYSSDKGQLGALEDMNHWPHMGFFYAHVIITDLLYTELTLSLPPLSLFINFMTKKLHLKYVGWSRSVVYAQRTEQRLFDHTETKEWF